MKKFLTIFILLLLSGIPLISCLDVYADNIPDFVKKEAYEILNDPAYIGKSVTAKVNVDQNGNYIKHEIEIENPERYAMSKAAVAAASDDFYNRYIEGKIPEGSEDWRFKREMEIIKFMVSNIDYAAARRNANANIDEDFSAYGALINHEAVCDGYTKCFNVLAKRCGLESIKVAGNGHSWNIVKLDDGNYYHVDVSWEDPTIDGQPNKIYGYDKLLNNYINLTSEKIKAIGGQSHSSWDDTTHECNSDIYGTDKVNRYFQGIK